MKLLLIGPTALDFGGKPIKQRKLHLPGLTLPMLAAVTSPDIQLKLVSETVEDIPFDEPWDLVGITGMGSGIVRAWPIFACLFISSFGQTIDNPDVAGMAS